MVKGKKKEIFRKIQLDLIDRPDDILRLEIDDVKLRELADSIAGRGLMQPIGVAPREDRFLIVFGDRRFLAHKLLGLKDIMCKVEDIPDSQIIIDRAVENVQRVDLTPFEEGRLYSGMIEEGGFSLDAVCGMLGKSAGVVQRRIDILRMPDSFQKALHFGQISISVAEELWSCPDEGRREYFLNMAVEHGITKGVARDWVAEFKKSKRSGEVASEGGGGLTPVYEDMPIYRGCDICRGPVEYKDLKELRVCGVCHKGIVEVLKKDS